MLSFLFSYEFKQFIRDRQGILFGIVLPLALGLMYYFALGNLVTDIDFKPTVAAVVYQDGSRNMMTDNLSQLGTTGSIQDGKVTYPEMDTSQANLVFVETDEELARKLINQEEAHGIIYVTTEEGQIHFELEVASTAINSMDSDLLYYALNAYQTIANNISLGMQTTNNPLRYTQEMMNIMSNPQEDVVVNKDGKEIHSQAVYFYAILGYVCMYFLSLGLMSVNKHDSYMFEEAKRLNLSPVPRVKRFAVSFISLWIPGLLVIYALLAFYWNQGIPLGNSWLDLVVLMTLGVTAGYLTGVAIASHFKLSEGGQTAVTVAIPLFFGAFSGMMAGGFKTFADQYFPLINKFNPIGLVSNALYYLTHYPTKTAFNQQLLYLGIYIAICLIIAVIGLRRDFHENI